jgi:hypothetical protein
MVMKKSWLTGLTAALVAAAATSAVDAPVDAHARWHWEAAPRLVAFGDVHGAYAALADLLETARVVDDALHWSGGDTHIVAMGDLIDRGPDSRAVLDLVMRLQDEARAAGGQFHVVLGNHEVMNLLADYRYVSDEDFAGFSDLEPPGRREQALEAFSAAQTGSSADAIRTEFLERYPPGYFGRRAAFGPAGIYGSWLLSLPVLVAVGDTAFVHGGLPPVVSELGGDALNVTLRRDLRGFIAQWQTLTSAGVIEWDTDPLDAAVELATRLGEGPEKGLPDDEHRAAAQAFVAHSRSAAFDETGPFWYRGTAYCHPLLEEAVLEEALAALGVKRVVIGHSPTANRRIVSRLAGGAVLVDTGMYDAYYHGRKAALVVEPDGMSALYPGEPARTALSIEQPNALSPYRDFAEIERMLAEAPESPGESAESGDRRYTLLELSTGESRLDTRFTSARGYEKEIAAWRLDRELGLGMVPPAARRTVKGKKGALMLWAGKLRSEADRAEGEFERPNWCASGNDYQLMYVFDALLHNPRTTESIRYTWAQKSLVLTDHLQAFGTQSDIPEYLRGADVVVPRELGVRLAALDRECLEGLLGDLLSGRQIRAVLERRDRILERWPPPAPEQSGGAGSSPAAAR